jgi:hypothetical protein
VFKLKIGGIIDNKSLSENKEEFVISVGFDKLLINLDKKEIANLYKINSSVFVSTIVIEDTQPSFQKLIQSSREKYEITMIECTKAPTLNTIIQDARIDGVVIGIRSNFKVFNRNNLKRLKDADKLVFLDLSKFYNNLQASEIRNLVEIVGNYNLSTFLPILINVDCYDVRTMRDLFNIVNMINPKLEYDISLLSKKIKQNSLKLDQKGFGDLITFGVED